jgi:hypothetical protein
MMKTIAALGAVVGLLLAPAGCSQREQRADEQAAALQKQPEPASQQAAQEIAVAQPAASAARPAAPQASARKSDPSAAPVSTPAAGPAAVPAPAAAPAATPPTIPLAQRPAAPPAPVEVTIPAGTAIVIRTANLLSSGTSKAGAEFRASLEQDLVVDGKVLAAKGADVGGYVVSSDEGGRVQGRASIAVGLRSITGTNGQPIQISTESHTAVARSTVKRDAVKTGILSGIGAAVGAIAGGGRGAAIGAGAGAAAGAGSTLATRGEAAEIPAESVLTLKLSAPAAAVYAK